MIQEYKEKLENRGVSPVIGVILLVAVTVALVALITVIVFNIGDNVSESTDATIDVQETNEGISVDVIRNDNVDKIRVDGPDGSSDEFDADVGSINNIDDGSGSYSVVAVLDDGSEETIKTITVLPSDSEGILTGIASVNPDIDGATVEALDSDGNILESTITNEDGMYKFNVENIDNVNNIQDIDKLVLIIDGFEHPELDYPVYASVERTELTDEEPVDFSFDGVEEDVGGETVIVSNEIEEESSDVKTIATIEQLQAIKNDKSNNYKLIRDIDASGTSDWNNGAGFEPIGEFDKIHLILNLRVH